jgi:beta-1,4-N-acetylglucosaminyltransferase
MSTFVSVGNATQPFFRLLAALDEIRSSLSPPVVVQCGSTPYASPHFQVEQFVRMDRFVNLLETSDIVILHAGAGSIIQARNAGRVPIVMPRMARHGEVVDDHQLALANALDAAGKVIVVQDAEEMRGAVSRIPPADQRAMQVQSELVESVKAAIRTYEAPT